MRKAACSSFPPTTPVEVDHPGLDVPVTCRMLTGKMNTATAMEWTTENLQALYKMGTYDATQGVKRSPFRPPGAAKRGGFERSGWYLLNKPRVWIWQAPHGQAALLPPPTYVRNHPACQPPARTSSMNMKRHQSWVTIPSAPGPSRNI